MELNYGSLNAQFTAYWRRVQVDLISLLPSIKHSRVGLCLGYSAKSPGWRRNFQKSRLMMVAFAKKKRIFIFPSRNNWKTGYIEKVYIWPLEDDMSVTEFFNS